MYKPIYTINSNILNSIAQIEAAKISLKRISASTKNSLGKTPSSEQSTMLLSRGMTFPTKKLP